MGLSRAFIVGFSPTEGVCTHPSTKILQLSWTGRVKK